MPDNESLFVFGELGYVICSSPNVADNLRKLPESSLFWEPSKPRCGFTARCEEIDGASTIYQEAVFEGMENFRLNLKFPKFAVKIYNGSSENKTHFRYDGLEYLVVHKLLLPKNYKQPIKIPD